MSPLLKQLFLPPTSVILLLFAALLLTRRCGDVGWWVSMLAAIFLYALATPLCSNALSGILEIYPPLRLSEAKDAQAIVIPGSDIDYSVERNRETVGSSTLARLRYGAWLHAQTNLPILVSGGTAKDTDVSLADSMHQALADDYGISKSWTETKSRDTWENAVNSAAILRNHDISRILLVTDARDMPRALRAYRLTGLSVIPAPMGFERDRLQGLATLVPSPKALITSYFAIYEIVGGLEYRVIHP